MHMMDEFIIVSLSGVKELKNQLASSCSVLVTMQLIEW